SSSSSSRRRGSIASRCPASPSDAPSSGGRCSPGAAAATCSTDMQTRAFVLSADANGRAIVSVHVKLTYRLLPSGACALAEEQGPLLDPRRRQPAPRGPHHAE